MNVAARFAIALVRGYQRTLSPFKGPTCRFVPSCSQYTIESIEKKGLLIGTWKGLTRILRCHPFARGGYDPVD